MGREYHGRHPYGPKLTSKLPNKILIGTHHKTGTAWLGSIFRAICRYHSLHLYNGSQEGLPKEFDVFFQNHSVFDIKAIPVAFRGLHIIRDPRDIVISGCFYHQKSEEKWLHVPREDLHGMTYQQKINSYDNLDDQILFEMEHASRITMTEMMSWNYTLPAFYEIKYEELIEDIELILFHKIFSFLGFPENVTPGLLLFAYNKSLFFKQHKKSIHIRSGRPMQWKRYFKQSHKDRFLELFDDSLIRLGYENDNNWMCAD